MISKPSPNHGPRPAGMTPDMIVVHGTAGSDKGDIEWCTNPKSEVSYQIHIARSGIATRLVADNRRAWHAGVSSWKGRTDGKNSVNGFSLGVALGLRENEIPTDAQYKTLAAVIKQWQREYNIPMERVVGHYHVSPGRKFDPWVPAFDWARVWEAMR